jgi:hypothetical protein
VKTRHLSVQHNGEPLALPIDLFSVGVETMANAKRVEAVAIKLLEAVSVEADRAITDETVDALRKLSAIFKSIDDQKQSALDNFGKKTKGKPSISPEYKRAYDAAEENDIPEALSALDGLCLSDSTN